MVFVLRIINITLKKKITNKKLPENVFGNWHNILYPTVIRIILNLECVVLLITNRYFVYLTKFLNLIDKLHLLLFSEVVANTTKDNKSKHLFSTE